MNLHFKTLASIFVSVAALLSSSPSSARTSTPILDGWHFIQADVPNAEQTSFDDSKWSIVSIPHSWNTTQANGVGPLYQGVGWYRKSFQVDATTAPGSRLILRIGAAHQEATVYINGHLIGLHQGGYTAFAYDITSYVSLTEPNEIAVRVSNAINPDIAPLSADFTFFGGIYRDVVLMTIPPVHVSPLDFASSGIAALAQNVSLTSADVHVTAQIGNALAIATAPSIRFSILDSQNAVVATNTVIASLSASTVTTPVQTVLHVANPHLWNGRSDPYLYHVTVEVLQNEQTVDQVSQSIGIRAMTFDANAGFSLNGHHLELRGLDLHQDWQGKGWALGHAERTANIELLKDIGANAVRLSHYPHSDDTLDMLDAEGFVAWAEIPLINGITISSAFEATTKNQLTEMIRQQINHPSIAMWSVFNEIPKDTGGLIGRLSDLAHAEDPTRPTTGASNQPPENAVNHFTDILGFNHYEGWYSGAANGFGKAIDQARNKMTIPIAISEYGAGANINQHQDPPMQPQPGGDFHPEEYQNIFHESYFADFASRPYLWGHFIWNLCDFSSWSRHEGGQVGINDKGLVTYDRQIKKDAYYFYRANWNPDPTLYITSRRFNYRTISSVRVKIYTNLKNLKLAINGAVSNIPLNRTGAIAIWNNVLLKPGANTIHVTAQTSSGKVFSDEVTWLLNLPNPTKKP